MMGCGKNKLIIHIGTPKTGTSTIQQFLSENQSQLNEAGFSYPIIQKGKFKYINGAILDNYIINGYVDKENAGWKAFWKDVKGLLQNRYVIISWENISLSYNLNDFFSAVKNEYENICVIVYLRRQDRYLESLWNQAVKFGACNKMSFYPWVSMRSLAYKEKIDTIAQGIGKENMLVRVYEKEQFQGERQNLLSDFLYALHIEIDWNKCVFPQLSNNSALFGNFVEIKRRINQYLKPGTELAWDIDGVFMYYFTQSSAGVKHADGMFSPKEREDFMKQYEEENAAIAREYLGRKDGVLFYENKPIPMHCLDDASLCDNIKQVFVKLIESWKGYMVTQKDDLCDITITSSECVDFTLKSILEKLNEIQEYSGEIFEQKCFAVLDKYVPFLVKIYGEKLQYDKSIASYFQKKSAGKKIYYMGSGGYGYTLIDRTKFQLQPEAVLDNDLKKQGQTLMDIEILHPSQITNWNDCFVIIAVKKPDVIAAMEQQLQGYGLKKDMDYLIGPEYLSDL